MLLTSFLCAAALSPPLAGHWVLHLYIEDRLFDDTVDVVAAADGTLGGTLVVPGRFTAALEHVQSDPVKRTVSFEIMADEGHGPFRVRYAGTMHGAHDTFVGFATEPGAAGAKDVLLGGFVAQRRP